MKKVKNEVISKERVCKKCGEPLRSTSKYQYCDNCRREKAKVRKEIGGGIGVALTLVLSCIPVVKHFVNKK